MNDPLASQWSQPLDVLTKDDWNLIQSALALALASAIKGIDSATSDTELRMYQHRFQQWNNLVIKVGDVRP